MALMIYFRVPSPTRGRWVIAFASRQTVKVGRGTARGTNVQVYRFFLVKHIVFCGRHNSAQTPSDLFAALQATFPFLGKERFSDIRKTRKNRISYGFTFTKKQSLSALPVSRRGE